MNLFGCKMSGFKVFLWFSLWPNSTEPFVGLLVGPCFWNKVVGAFSKEKEQS